MRQAGRESINQSINQSEYPFCKDVSFDLYRIKIDANPEATTYQGSSTK